MCKFSVSAIEKLGNTLIFIVERVNDLSKTKALKLLYLMEERMALKYHTPFLAIPFEVWQAGPVAKDVFIDLSDSPYLLKDFVKTEQRDNGTYISAIRNFSGDEFSECEIAMMNEVLDEYGKLSASELVAVTHRKGSLWYKEAEKNGLLSVFSHHECNNSDVRIDFTEMMLPCAAEFYRESLNVRQTADLLRVEANV